MKIYNTNSRKNDMYAIFWTLKIKINNIDPTDKCSGSEKFQLNMKEGLVMQ